MKEHEEKNLKGGMRATGFSAVALLCVCLANIFCPAPQDKYGISSDVVIYLAVGSLVCSIILFVYYLTKYRFMKEKKKK